MMTKGIKRVYTFKCKYEKSKGGLFMLNQKVADLLNQQINKEVLFRISIFRFLELL